MSKEPAPLEPEGRKQLRSSLFLAAVMKAGAEQTPVKVRNMSLNGAMIDSPLTPPPGTDVQLIRGSLAAHGKVIWASEKQCGLRFSSELSIKEWLASPSRAEQQRVDEIVSLVKAGAIPIGVGRERNVGGSRGSDRALDVIHGLEGVLNLLEDLENDLSSSDETLGRHGPKLQNLDIAMQMVRALLRELADPTGDADGALDDLRIVCAQALKGQ